MAAVGARVADWLQKRFELAGSRAGANVLPMEGLRGFAVLLVFVVHFATLVEPWLLSGSLTQRLLALSRESGHAGVDLFFVISGYLIYGHLLTRDQAFGRYLRRRVQRIYPTFLAVFAVYVALSLAGHGGKLPHEPLTAALWLLANLLLLPGVLPIEPLITVAWSLSYEMFFYLVLPVAFAALQLRRRSGGWRIVAFAAMLGLGLLAGAAFGGPVRMAMFISGILLHEVLRRGSDRVPGTATALAALTFALAATHLPIAGSVGQALETASLCAGFGVLCLVCFARPGSAIGRAFCWPPLRWLGNMSYSYYLVHGLALKVLFTALEWVVPPAGDGRFGLNLLVPAFLCTLGVAALLYLAVERRFSLAPRPPLRRRVSEVSGHA